MIPSVIINPISTVRMRAVKLLREGIWAVCVDEKTSIQARQLEQEPTPANPGQPVHVASRYKRQGAYANSDLGQWHHPCT